MERDVDRLAARATAAAARAIPPTDAAAEARSDVAWARSHIGDGIGVFDAVMEHEMTFAEIGGGSEARAARASRAFKRAAADMLSGVGERVLRRLSLCR
jgi:hypothetical protein